MYLYSFNDFETRMGSYMSVARDIQQICCSAQTGQHSRLQRSCCPVWVLQHIHAMPPPLLVRERVINDTLLHSLSANLTWRDVMYLVVYTSDTSITAAGSYTTNGAGRKFSPKFGFGILDTEAVVARARHWINVPPQIEHIRIPSRPSGLVY